MASVAAFAPPVVHTAALEVPVGAIRQGGEIEHSNRKERIETVSVYS